MKGDRSFQVGAHRRTAQASTQPRPSSISRVLDPAMGSGHFLVTAVDFLSDYIAELLEYLPAVPDWAGWGVRVSHRGSGSRSHTGRTSFSRARESDWVIDESLLTDQAIIRRMVLKRCIYGVDKNPLTVELAKVSLWLHSFTVGAPLSFLDHHLRCGDSLIGMRVQGSIEELRRLSGLFASSAIQGAENATVGDAADRGDVGRGRCRGTGIGVAVPGGGGYDCADARPARLPVRPEMAHGGHE